MPLEGFLCHVTPKFRKKDEFLFLRCKSFAKSVQIFEATDGRITFHHIVFLKQNGLNLTHNLNNKRVGLVSSITRTFSVFVRANLSKCDAYVCSLFLHKYLSTVILKRHLLLETCLQLFQGLYHLTSDANNCSDHGHSCSAAASQIIASLN